MENRCPICGMPFDNNHFAPTSFPGIDQRICCNCDENLSLMFTNLEDKPGDHGYTVPDYSEQLEKLTGRSYLENRLLFYKYVLVMRKTEEKPNYDVIREIKDEIEKCTRAMSIKN